MPDYEPEKIVYLVRHGQSVHNVQPIFQSEMASLSGAGRKQAEFIAKRVSKLSYEALIASPLPRTKQTVQIIGRATKTTPEFSNLFVERRKPSDLDGKPYTDSVASKLWRKWEDNFYKLNSRVADSESYGELIVRADKALEYLKQRSEKKIVVVSHGIFIRTLVARVMLGGFITPETLKHYIRVTEAENTGLTVLLYQAGFEQEPCWRLWIYNDHAHLAE